MCLYCDITLRTVGQNSAASEIIKLKISCVPWHDASVNIVPKTSLSYIAMRHTESWLVAEKFKIIDFSASWQHEAHLPMTVKWVKLSSELYTKATPGLMCCQLPNIEGCAYFSVVFYFWSVDVRVHGNKIWANSVCIWKRYDTILIIFWTPESIVFKYAF